MGCGGGSPINSQKIHLLLNTISPRSTIFSKNLGSPYRMGRFLWQVLVQNSPVLHLGEYAIRPLGACKSGDAPPPAAWNFDMSLGSVGAIWRPLIRENDGFPLLGTNISHQNDIGFWRWFSELPKVGYVSSLEGNNPWVNPLVLQEMVVKKVLQPHLLWN